MAWCQIGTKPLPKTIDDQGHVDDLIYFLPEQPDAH